MIVRLEVDGLSNAEKVVRRATTTLLAIRDLRDVFELMGVRIAAYIAGRWDNPQGIAPLAPSTLEARGRRSGYYKAREDRGRLTGSGALAFWWTGKSMRQAVRGRRPKAWRAERRALHYTFGPRIANRDRLGFMHFGAPGRPARPLYHRRPIADIAQRTVREFLDDLAGERFVIRRS